MTDREFIDLQKELLKYNGKVSNSMARRFIKEIASNQNTLKLARAHFGENGVYRASAKDIDNFIRQHYYYEKTVDKGGAK